MSEPRTVMTAMEVRYVSRNGARCSHAFIHEGAAYCLSVSPNNDSVASLYNWFRGDTDMPVFIATMEEAGINELSFLPEYQKDPAALAERIYMLAIAAKLRGDVV